MDVHSRYIKFEEFEKMARQIPSADVLIEHKGTLCIKGITRGSFYMGNCFSLHGVYPITKAIGDAWMISHPTLLKKFPLAPHRSARQVILDAFRDFQLDAIQIQVPDDFHVRWCESMGFVKIKKDGERVHLMILK